MFPSSFQSLLWTASFASKWAAPVEPELHIAKRADLIPIMDGQNFPDPGFVRTGDGWHAFSTNGVFNGTFVHVQRTYTPDWKTWKFTPGADAMPKLASWIDTASPRVWAPDVNELSDGSFIMYYTAALKSKTNLHCVSYALSKNVDGPYADPNTSPFICPQAQGGAIDPAGYVNPKDGTRWITYKIDGNAIGHGGECGNTVAPIVPTPLLAQQVAADGFTKIGTPIELLTNTASDGAYVEAPSLSFLNGKFVLFFSPQCYLTPKYSVNYAISDKLLGPYTRAPNPLFSTGVNGLKAPGGLDIAVNGDHAMFHGDFKGGRAAYTAILRLVGNTVTATF